MKKQLGYIFTKAEIFALIICLGVGGWVANIVKLAGSNFDPIPGMVVIRVIGIFVAPLGAVLGFL